MSNVPSYDAHTSVLRKPVGSRLLGPVTSENLCCQVEGGSLRGHLEALPHRFYSGHLALFEGEWFELRPGLRDDLGGAAQMFELCRQCLRLFVQHGDLPRCITAVKL